VEFLHAKEAMRACEANLSPRYHRLDKLERYVEGTQYDGRKSFWDESVPVFERAPCFVYPIFQHANQSNTDLCLGEGKFPAITALSNEDDAAFDDQFGLDEEQSEILDRFILGIEKQASLRSVCRESLNAAQSCGTAVAIGGIRNGRLVVDTTKAKWCKAEHDETTGAVTSLEIRYPYLEEYKDERENKWALRCMLYRRVIDTEFDTTYLPAKADEEGREPNWVADKSKTLAHGLGFCPVLWYRFLKPCSTVNDIDGEPPHRHLLDECDALNFAISLRHRGAMYASSPQYIETGVDKGYNPAPMGRMAEVVIGGGIDPITGATMPSYVTPASGKEAARQTGPGVIWTYENEGSDVKLLTLPGDALDPADNNCRDLRAKIAEGLCVVFTDTENTLRTVDISGRALREMHKKQTEHCDQIRDDFGNHFLLPLVDMLLRIVLAKPKGLYLSGVKKVLPILAKFNAQIEGGTSQWFAPALELDWGEYFPLTGLDKQQDIMAVTAAKEAKLITHETAVGEMRDYFPIGNVPEYMLALEKEDAENQQKAVDNAKAMAEASGPSQFGGGKLAPKGKQPQEAA
jgi:hypothetical protein